MRYQVDVYTDEAAQQRRLEEDVRRGLTAWQKSLPAKYFYDRAGSLLFERITELSEYYPTRTEAALLQEIVPELIGEFLPADLARQCRQSCARDAGGKLCPYYAGPSCPR